MEIKDFDNSTYLDALAVMKNNRGHFNDPKVGIFFMNDTDVFGIRTQYVKDILHTAYNNLVTINILHNDVYRDEEYRSYKYHYNIDEQLIKNRKNQTRGRIFYNIETDIYIIYTNNKNLIKDSKQYNIILEEFDIPTEKIIIKYIENMSDMLNTVKN